MDHTKFEKMADRYILRSLGIDEANIFEEHMMICHQCFSKVCMSRVIQQAIVSHISVADNAEIESLMGLSKYRVGDAIKRLIEGIFSLVPTSTSFLHLYSPAMSRSSTNDQLEFKSGDQITVEVETRSNGYLLSFYLDCDGACALICPTRADHNMMLSAGDRVQLNFIISGNTGLHKIVGIVLNKDLSNIYQAVLTKNISEIDRAVNTCLLNIQRNPSAIHAIQEEIFMVS